MVIHNPDTQQQWVHRREEQQRKEKKHEHKHKQLRWSLVGVQSLACVAILLLTFVLKLAGGTAYEQLKQRFRGAMAENQLMSVLMEVFEEESGVKGKDFTLSKTQEGQGLTAVSLVAAPRRWGDV